MSVALLPELFQGGGQPFHKEQLTMTNEARNEIADAAFELLEETPAHTFWDVKTRLVSRFGVDIQNGDWFYGADGLYGLVERRKRDIALRASAGITQAHIDEVRTLYVPRDFRGTVSRSRAAVRVIARARGRSPRRRTSRGRPTLALAHASPARPGRPAEDSDPEPPPPLVRRLSRAFLRAIGWPS